MTRTEPEDPSALPQELTTFIAGLPAKIRSKVRESLGPGPDGYAWQLQLEPSDDAIDVSSLTKLDILVNVRLTRLAGSTRTKVELKNIPQGRTLRLQISHAAEGKLRFLGLHGLVDIAGVEQAAHVVLTDSCDGSVQFGPGTFKVLGQGETPPRLLATSGARLTLENATFNLWVSGECELRESQLIRRLIVDRVASVTSLDQVLAAETIKASEGTATLNVATAALDHGYSPPRSKPPIVSVSSISNITLQCRIQRSMTGSPELKVSQAAANVTVHGPFVVTLEKWSTSKGLTSKGEASILAKEGAVLTGLSRDWTIEKAAGAHLLGTDDGFGINAISSSEQKAAMTGSVLIGFRLPERKTRRRTLAALESAYHLDPYARDLPGGGPRYNERRPFRSRISDTLMDTLAEDAEFVRELARLARKAGAPGSTRTRIAWCAYRLRHQSSRKWERLAYWAYRKLGYGERPGPAFLTWIVLAVISTAITLAWIRRLPLEVSPSGIGAFAGEVLIHALGPAGALFGTGAPETEGWQYALRALVAIPLVTGALALRNYVKQAGP